ncbi:glutamate carboxypeptidase [Chamaesiphon sp. GL140_3_metabinner_50]|uniref:glutamate carboxypeptidase n=1 Tax=Chamaesiphon sp. GL140_3_metabinner_50 TaxID=2970812 RepID=UPI0025F0E804|nr:glutamate carboxypeptidase [Chamaesiphon sp. GL140_3_metabinner_50]
MRLRVIACIAIASLLCVTLVQFNAVAITDSIVYDRAKQSQTTLLEPLKTLVNIDSGTGDLQGLTKVENIVIDRLKSIGADVKTIDAKPSAGRNTIATIRGTGKGKILLLAHTDTVFKQGGAIASPFKIANGKAYGLGIMDDKGSILLGIEALRILKDLNFKNFGTITFLINPDEEKGSLGSRELIKATAKKHDVALVLEFGSPQDKVTSWRKGIGYYGIEVKGRKAHAGAEPEKGCNALLEAAHQTLQMSKLGDPKKQTTVNFTVLNTGDNTPNTIPDFAKVQADVRVLEAQEYTRLERDFTRFSQQKLLPCTQIKVIAEKGRPPFPANPQTDALVKKAQAIYQTIGLKLGVEGSGGGTDGNYAAAVGTTTLDALGLVGGGAHTKDEYIEIDRIAPRIYLLTKLLMDLGGRE